MPAVKRAEIRRRRQETGMKLGQFAEHAGVGYKTLANIECGTQKFVSIEVVHRIAKGLGLTAKDILAEENTDDEMPEASGAAA
jgi:transcriptional regulator with XRE-family HTH domain